MYTKERYYYHAIHPDGRCERITLTIRDGEDISDAIKRAERELSALIALLPRDLEQQCKN